MNTKQLEQILKDLTIRAEVAESQQQMTDCAQIELHIDRLRKWEAAGMTGDCPVNLNRYGIRLDESQEDETSEKPSAQPDRQAEVAAPAAAQEPPLPEQRAEMPTPSPAVEVERGAAPTEVQVQSWLVETRTSEEREVVTIEVENWRMELERAVRLMETDLPAAIVLLLMIKKAEKASADVYERADFLLAEAQSKRDGQIKAYMERAHQARNRNQWEQAEEFYIRVLRLDSDNQDAQQELYDGQTKKKRQAFLEEIKRNLIWKTNNVQELERAVRQAENVIARKEADEELVELHNSARARFDQLRQQMGVTTTKMRMGSLYERAEAVHEYKQYLIGGMETIRDDTNGSYRKTSDVFYDALELWRYTSREETDKELRLVGDQWPHNLDFCRNRLEKDINSQFFDKNDEIKRYPLGYIFCDEHLLMLQKRLAQIERDVERRDFALALLDLARNEEIETALFRMKEAQSTWPHLEGINQRINDQRQLVANHLAVEISHRLQGVESCLMVEDFQGAYELAEEAQRLYDRFPGEALEVMVSASARLPEIKKSITSAHNRYFRFTQEEDNIRHLLEDPHTQASAVELFDDLKSQPEFSDYARTKMLGAEVIAYREAGEQLLYIQRQLSVEDPDWKGIQNLCNQLISQRKGGDIARQVEQIPRPGWTAITYSRCSPGIKRR